MQLSPRLSYIVSRVNEKASVIDVAADHGYVALALAKTNDKRKIIISDIAKMPLQAGQNNFEVAGLVGDFRLGNGLAVLSSDEQLDSAIIAGIGGRLMVDILAADFTVTRQVETYHLAPNIGAELVRAWLYKNKYHIIINTIVEDGEHFYQYIEAKRAETKDEQYPEVEAQQMLAFFFGHDIKQRLAKKETVAWLRRVVTTYDYKIVQVSKGASVEALAKKDTYTAILNYAKELLEINENKFK